VITCKLHEIIYCIYEFIFYFNIYIAESLYVSLLFEEIGSDYNLKTI